MAVIKSVLISPVIRISIREYHSSKKWRMMVVTVVTMMMMKMIAARLYIYFRYGEISMSLELAIGSNNYLIDPNEIYRLR